MDNNSEKQVVSETAFAPAGAYDDDNQPDYEDPGFWRGIDKNKVAPLSTDSQRNDDERLKNIERMYPTFSQEKIELDRLIPAKAEWNFFPKQENGIKEELMKNIAAYGQLSPAIVWEQADGKYMILGGHTRYLAIKRLYEVFAKAGDYEEAKRFQTLNCNVYGKDEIDEIEARKIIIFDNVIRRENTTAIKVQAIINMNRLEHDTRQKRKWGIKRAKALATVANALGENENTIKKLYKLRSLIPEFWPLVDSKDPSERISHQFAGAVAGLGNNLQKYIYQNKLYKIKLLTPQLNLLKKAADTDGIDAVFNAEPIQIISSKAHLTSGSVEDCVGFTVVCPKDEVEKIKGIVFDALSSSNEISQRAKDMLAAVWQQ